MPEWLQLQTFYNGLDASARYRLYGIVGGALMNKTYCDAYELIENMAMNSCQWPTKRFTYGKKPATVKAIQEEDRYQQLVDRLNRIESITITSQIQEDKPLYHYFTNPTGDVNYVGDRGGNPYSNTYNLGWKGYPNLRWGELRGK